MYATAAANASAKATIPNTETPTWMGRRIVRTPGETSATLRPRPEPRKKSKVTGARNAPRISSAGFRADAIRKATTTPRESRVSV